MTLDGEFRAVLDRVEDGVGVLLVEADGEVIEEVHVAAETLPADVADGAIFQAAFDAGELAELTHRPQETERRREEMQSRVDDLAQRPPGRERDEDDAGEREK